MKSLCFNFTYGSVSPVLCVYICITWEPGVHKGQKRMLELNYGQSWAACRWDGEPNPHLQEKTLQPMKSGVFVCLLWFLFFKCWDSLKYIDRKSKNLSISLTQIYWLFLYSIVFSNPVTFLLWRLVGPIIRSAEAAERILQGNAPLAFLCCVVVQGTASMFVCTAGLSPHSTS